ncbi:MAG: EamA family transporter [Thermodesulfovibrionales bacterium]
MVFKTEWLVFSLLTLILWGIWGFFSKIATIHSSASSVYLYGSVGALVVTLFSIFFLGFRFDVHPLGIMYGILGGISGGAGIILFYLAIREGKVSIVVTLTALYPLVTLLLSYIILKEQITLKQTIGIFFALIAMVLIST